METLGIIVTIANLVLLPASNVITWFFTRKKRKNDFLKELQTSVDILSVANTNYMNQIIELRNEILQNDQNSNKLLLKLQEENNALKEQLRKLNVEVQDLNEQLKNVKTITKSK